MKFTFKNKKLSEIKADCEVIFVIDKDLKHRWVYDKDDLNTLDFKGNLEDSAFLPHQHRIYIGANLESDELRIASSKAISSIKKAKYKSLKIALYSSKKCASENVKAIVEGFILGAYNFDKYKSEKEVLYIKEIIFANEDYSNSEINEDKIIKAIKEAEIRANATNFTKDIVNSMPNELTPKEMGNIATKLAKDNLLECVVQDEKFLANNGMNAFLSVARASSNHPRLIHLTYKPKNAKMKVAIVGKGLTYDSGGLSLKGGEHMVTMKSDKSGASAVLGIMKAISELGLNLEVHGIIGACENMIGGNAYKPDDILIAKNKKTIEVRNTDAEGRLVLADCLTYAQEFNPDYIIDLATLTGACVIALGEYTSGVMGFSDELKQKMLQASKQSGELVATLPFNRYLPKLLKSSVADISNVSSSRYGGAITAGLFLSEFIEEKNRDKWLHIDIAGPSYVEKAWGYNQYGASGSGVRIMIDFLESLDK